MVNLGKVEIKGVDVTATAVWEPLPNIRLNLSGNCTSQRALDVTSPGGKTYHQQIAYTPRVSGSGQAALETPWLNLSYSFVHSGVRYVLGQNLEENKLAAYTDHSIAADRSFQLKKVNINLRVEVLNLTDKYYEVIREFPVPGRSVRATLYIRY
jgi:outer membrane receptor protein involved in Fe transport